MRLVSKTITPHEDEAQGRRILYRRLTTGRRRGSTVQRLARGSGPADLGDRVEIVVGAHAAGHDVFTGTADRRIRDIDGTFVHVLRRASILASL